jgi:hypothetical protein
MYKTMIFDHFNVYSHVVATEEKKLWMRCIPWTRCGDRTSMLWAHRQASRPSFAPAEDLLLRPVGWRTVRRQLWLCALGWGAVDDAGGGSCRPDKMRQRRSLPGNRHLPRATDNHHARSELLTPTATETVDDGAAWGWRWRRRARVWGTWDVGFVSLTGGNR